MTIDVEDRLAAMDDVWAETEAKGGGSSELPPDGTYQATVSRFDFFEQKKNGRLMLVTEFVVASGEHKNASAPVFHDLEDPERFPWLKGFLEILGVEVDPFHTLRDRLSGALDTPVEIRVKTSDQTNAAGEPYRNVYLNKRLGPPQSDLPADTAGMNNGGGHPDDDVPF